MMELINLLIHCVLFYLWGVLCTNAAVYIVLPAKRVCLVCVLLVMRTCQNSGFGFCLLSLLCAVLLGLFDKRAERILKRKENGTGEQISLKDVKDFPLRLWLVFIICVAYYVTVFPFIGLATYVLSRRTVVDINTSESGEL